MLTLVKTLQHFLRLSELLSIAFLNLGLRDEKMQINAEEFYRRVDFFWL